MLASGREGESKQREQWLVRLLFSASTSLLPIQCFIFIALKPIARWNLN